MRGARRHSGFKRTKRRRMSWTGAFAFYTNQTLSDEQSVAFWARVPAGAIDNTGAAIPLLVPDDWTLVRTRLLYAWASNNGAAQVTHPWSAGIGLIDWDGLTDNPLDLGNSIPHVVEDTDEDWVFRNIGPAVQDNIVLGGNGGGDLDAYQSRAMRKLSAGKGLLCVFSVSQAVPENLIFNISVDVRMLFKEA